MGGIGGGNALASEWCWYKAFTITTRIILGQVIY